MSLCQLLEGSQSRCSSSASLSILQTCGVSQAAAYATRPPWKCHHQSICLPGAALLLSHRTCQQDTNISFYHRWAHVFSIRLRAPRCLCSTRMRRCGEARQCRLQGRPASHDSLVSSIYSSTSMGGLGTRTGSHLQVAGGLLQLDLGLSQLSCRPQLPQRARHVGSRPRRSDPSRLREKRSTCILSFRCEALATMSIGSFCLPCDASSASIRLLSLVRDRSIRLTNDPHSSEVASTKEEATLRHGCSIAPRDPCCGAE